MKYKRWGIYSPRLVGSPIVKWLGSGFWGLKLNKGETEVSHWFHFSAHHFDRLGEDWQINSGTIESSFSSDPVRNLFGNYNDTQIMRETGFAEREWTGLRTGCPVIFNGKFVQPQSQIEPTKCWSWLGKLHQRVGIANVAINKLTRDRHLAP